MPITRETTLSYKDGKILSQADAIMERFEIAILTDITEFGSSPDFGLGLNSYIDETSTKETMRALENHIQSVVVERWPQIQIDKLSIVKTALQTISVTLSIRVKTFNATQTIYKDVNYG